MECPQTVQAQEVCKGVDIEISGIWYKVRGRFPTNSDTTLIMFEGGRKDKFASSLLVPNDFLLNVKEN